MDSPTREVRGKWVVLGADSSVKGTPPTQEFLMPHLSIPSVDDAPAASRPLLDAVRRQLGLVPNLFKVIAHSPAALEGFLALNGSLAKGRLDTKLRECIALAVAEFNGCDYCLAAHTYLGIHAARLEGADVEAARDARSDDPRTQAALRFVRQVTAKRGRVTEEELAALRNAHFSEPEVIEIIAAVALNVLTNYLNNVAKTEIDFPQVAPAGVV
jgi:uncharacterized peroxidase-related enzyme